MVCILPNCILYFIFSPEVILYVYQTQNRFHMLHIELGFLLHHFIRNSLQGFLNIYHTEWTIWVGSCILECDFLSSSLNVNWCKRPWKIQLHRLDNSVENVSWSLYASLFHAETIYALSCVTKENLKTEPTVSNPLPLVPTLSLSKRCKWLYQIYSFIILVSEPS